MYRKTNINEMKNTRVPVNDKLVTFEGAEHLCIAGLFINPHSYFKF